MLGHHLQSSAESGLSFVRREGTLTFATKSEKGTITRSAEPDYEDEGVLPHLRRKWTALSRDKAAMLRTGQVLSADDRVTSEEQIKDPYGGRPRKHAPAP